MNKTIKIIDLLNKIANGKKLPKRIKWRDKIWDYIEKEQDYINHNIYFFEGFTQIRTKDFVTDTVEIIEDNTEEIEELEITEIVQNRLVKEIKENREKINELVKAVNSIRKDKSND